MGRIADTTWEDIGPIVVVVIIAIVVGYLGSLIPKVFNL